MTDEITIPLIQKINDAHGEFLEIGRKTSEALIAQVNKAREVGLYLQAFKEDNQRLNFTSCFSDQGAKHETRFTFTYHTGRNYMKLAAAMQEPAKELPDAVRCLTDVMRMTGALPESSRSAQTSHGALNWLSSFERQVMSAGSIIGKQVEMWDTSPPDAATKQHLKRTLEPFVAIYAKL